ncbi:MAG: hypothetical protein ACR2OA_21560 [Rubripirellula sp.]
MPPAIRRAVQRMSATLWDVTLWDVTRHAARVALAVAAAAPACSGMTVEAVWTTVCPEQISAFPCSPAWLMTAA